MKFSIKIQEGYNPLGMPGTTLCQLIFDENGVREIFERSGDGPQDALFNAMKDFCELSGCKFEWSILT